MTSHRAVRKRYSRGTTVDPAEKNVELTGNTLDEILQWHWVEERSEKMRGVKYIDLGK